MATDDLSDVNLAAGNNGDITPNQLPIRGEKRIIPVPADAQLLANSINNRLGDNNTFDTENNRTQLVEQEDFLISAALKPFVDYVIIRVQNRGITANGQPDASIPAVYRFLINPSQCSVQRTTLDGQAMSRAGWQIGVWGEDMVQITLNGKTAGQYWSAGRTDRYQPFTVSYRNLEQLVMVFENNGYWFEGEQASEGPLAADFSRRRIKMHQDVELIVGNFVWFGMFDTLTVTQSAEEPWLASFNLTFIAWKERFRSSSPYQNPIKNDLQRGHSYTAWASSTISNSHAIPSNAMPSKFLPPTQPVPTPNLIAQPSEVPTITSSVQDQILPQGIDPTAADHSPMQNVLYSTLPQFKNYWNGVK